MTRVFWSLSALSLVGFVACVSTTKPAAVEKCAQAGTCSDSPRDAALPPADSRDQMGAGGSSSATSSAGGTTSAAGTGGTASTGGSDATGGSASANGGQGNDAAGGSSAAGGSQELDGGLSSGGAVGSGGSATTGGTSTASGGTSSSGGIQNTGGTAAKGGTTGSGGAPGTGGINSKGGTTRLGGAPGTGGITSTGGTSSPPDVCKPLTAVINDFAASGCNYGNWTYGEMDSAAWSYANGTSSISTTCASGNWTFSGTVGVATPTSANLAGFGFTLMGKGYDSATSTEVSCKTFDLSAYSGFSIRLSSASGAITSVGIGVNLADGSQWQTEIAVTKTATTVPVTWAQLKITSAAQVTEIWGYFIGGSSSVTNDLVISHFGLQ